MYPLAYPGTADLIYRPFIFALLSHEVVAGASGACTEGHLYASCPSNEIEGITSM